MDDDDLVAQFVGITEAPADRAQQYLRISDGNIEQAVELYFSTGGVDLEGPSSSTPAQASQPSAESQPPQRSTRQNPVSAGRIVNLDSDEDEGIEDDEDPIITGFRSRPGGVLRSASRTPGTGTPTLPQPSDLEDEDAAMARRMQDEIYAGGDLSGVPGVEGYRAPIARTTETLVGPEAYDLTNRNDLRAAVEEQIQARRHFAQRRMTIDPLSSTIS